MKEIKFKNNRLTTRGVVSRLTNYYKNSSAEHKARGMSWYNEAHQFCVDLGVKAGVPTFQVAGVVSALSPMQSWDINRDNAAKFLIDKKDDVHTKAQVAKAHECLRADTPEEIFTLLTKDGVKTSWFFWNILYPNESAGVTIDRHAIGSSVFSMSEAKVIPDGYGNLTSNQYKFLDNAHRVAAERIGILPHQLQATIWGTYREARQLTNHKEYERVVPF